MTMAWSFSRLYDFENCNLLFQHKYILKTVPFVGNAATERGTKIHKQLERNVIRSNRQQSQVAGDVEHMIGVVRNFTNTHKTLFVEHKMAFKEDMSKCSWFDSETWFRAIVDVIGNNEEHSSIIDWKTGQYRVNPDQLRLYNVAVLTTWDFLKTASSALVFVDHKKSSPVCKTTREELPDILGEFRDRSEAIQIAVERDEWPAKKNFNCRWCSVSDCQYISR